MDKEPSQVGALRLDVDGEASDQDGGDGVGRVAAHLAQQVGALDRDG